jgi:hypothetical protein
LTLVNLFLINLREILTAALNQVLGIRDDTNTRDVVLERDVPEPAVASLFRSQHQRCAAV